MCIKLKNYEFKNRYIFLTTVIFLKFSKKILNDVTKEGKGCISLLLNIYSVSVLIRDLTRFYRLEKRKRTKAVARNMILHGK